MGYRLFSATLIALFLFAQTVSPALAVEPSPSPSPAPSPSDASTDSSASSIGLPPPSPIPGPQAIVGPLGPVGPTDPVGPTEPVGPQGPVGVQGVTGPASLTSASSTTSPTGSASSDPSASAVSPSSATAATQTTGSEASTTADSSADTTVGNSNTGSQSSNTATSDQNATTTINQTNTANIDNNVAVAATNGFNNANRNTGSASIKTGDITGTVTILNLANTRAAEQSTATSQSFNGPQTEAITVGNDQTGSNSANAATANKNNLVQIGVVNEADVDNAVDIFADTGHNTADDNTGNATIETGRIRLAIDVINVLNSVTPTMPVDLEVLTIFGDVLTDLLFPEWAAKIGNSQTGATSSNTANATANHDADLTVTNTADVNNAILYDLSTGDNTADRNTGGGSVQAGAMNASTAITNIANVPAPLWLINVYGVCDCDLSVLDPSKYIINVIDPATMTAENSQTGSGSANTAAANQNSDVDIDVTNDARVNNNIRVVANTGGNSASDNTGKAQIKTGDINVATNILNVLNSAIQSGQKLALGVINILGNWKGKAGIAQKPTVPAVQSQSQSGSNSQNSGSVNHTAAANQPSSQTAQLATANNPSHSSGLAASTTGGAKTLFSKSAAGSKPLTATIQPPQSSAQTTTSFSFGKTRSRLVRSADIDESLSRTVEVSATTDDVVTQITSPSPSAIRPTKARFADVAQAAPSDGLVGAARLPIGAWLLLPLGLWLGIELIFRFLIRRQQKDSAA